MAHDWGGPIGLGALLERVDRLLPSFVPAFLREFRTEGLGEILALGGNLFVGSIPGGMVRRDTDPVMMDAYRAPFPDYWSRREMRPAAETLELQDAGHYLVEDRPEAITEAIHGFARGL